MKCQAQYVKQATCHVLFQRAWPKGPHQHETLGETIRGESVIVERDAQGRIVALELVSDQKPCQRIVKR